MSYQDGILGRLIPQVREAGPPQGVDDT